MCLITTQTGNCISFHLWLKLRASYRWIDQKTRKKWPKKTKQRKVRRPLMTFLNRAMWKSSGRGKKTPTYCKSSLRGPSLSLFQCLPLFLLHAGPCPGSLGKCQAMDWQRMKGCGRRRGGRRVWGKVEAGAEERRFWGFQTPYLSNISTHFEQVQSQFMKQSTSIYRSPLTSPCFILGLLRTPI